MSETIEYIKSDLFRYHGRCGFREFLISFFFHPSFIYSFWFRLAKSKLPVIKNFALVMVKLKSWKFGLQIPPATEVGYGLYIGHGMAVVVNPTASIGNNCNLSQFTTIGSTRGRAAIIGDNVYIGPSVCIVEDVVIGSGAVIGAGSVVTNDVPENSVVGGVPARLIKFDDSKCLIHNPWLVKTLS